MKNGGEPNATMLNRVAGILSANPTWNSLEKYDFKLQNLDGFQFTKNSIFELENYLQSKNVPLILMGYPTVNIESYQNLFSANPVPFKNFRDSFYFDFANKPVIKDGFKNLYFVSNESFNSIVNSENYSKYFIDRFCAYSNCKFGHFTPATNDLITKNILDQEGELISNLILKKKH